MLMQVESALLFETPAEICARVYRSLRPRTPVPEFRVSFRKFANATSTIRSRGGVMELKITDLLADAPAPILEALAVILLSKLLRKTIPAHYSEQYRRYLNRHEVRQGITEMRQARGRKRIDPPAGHTYDLGDLFDAVNAQFFAGSITRPLLGWSRQASRTILGHCDSAHNTIVLSRILDQPHVPRFVAEYVMYHEMLHLVHPVESRGAKRSIHPPEFRAAEKRFPKIKEAKAFIRQLCSRSSPYSLLF
ncbi:MAG: DUF45 domain-containing protein [Acidobacteria bacterium]|nr:DUF45 domain-containing protein [Acidobacteriota bacterium]